MSEKTYEAEVGVRLDLFICDKIDGATRGYVQRLIERGGVTVSGKPRQAGYKLRHGETVTVRIEENKQPDLKILFEDDTLWLVDKPAGLIVHPIGESWLRSPETVLGEAEPSVVSWALTRRPESKTLERYGIIHRLDRDTSGVLAVAKDAETQKALMDQFRERTVDKTYLAVVVGKLEKKEGSIEAPVGRVGRKLVATPYGRPAKSSYKVLKEGKDRSLVEVKPLTGRTHQIRVHLAAIGHPVLGDTEHGGPESDRLYLHSHKLILKHKGKKLQAVSPAPFEFKA